MAVTSTRAPICNELPLPPFSKLDVASGAQLDRSADLEQPSTMSAIHQDSGDTAAQSPRHLVLAEVAECRAELESLHRKQEQMNKRQKEADEIRRGQLDSMTERIYQVEKELRAAQQQQEEAIDKANAAFQIHSFEVQRDRQNLMNLIGQINNKFDDFTVQLSQQSAAWQATQESVAEMQQGFQQTCWDAQGDHATLVSLGEDVTLLQEKVNEQQDTVDQARVTAERAHGRMMTMELHDELREAESRHEDQIKEMKTELRVLSARFDDMQTELQEMQPRILEALEKRGRQVLEPPSHGASQRTRRKLRPEQSRYQNDACPAAGGNDRGGQDHQSSRERASQRYAEYEASTEVVEEPHLDHGDSLSQAMRNWPLTSEEPAASEVPATSMAARQASAAAYEQHAVHGGHQSSASPSSHAYHMASGLFYSGLGGPGSGLHRWDSHYDVDFDGADHVLHDARQDVQRLASQDLGDGGHWPTMSPANQEILRLLRGGEHMYPPEYMQQDISDEDLHL